MDSVDLTDPRKKKDWNSGDEVLGPVNFALQHFVKLRYKMLLFPFSSVDISRVS